MVWLVSEGCNTVKAIKETIKGIGDFLFPSLRCGVFWFFFVWVPCADASAQPYRGCITFGETSASLWQNHDLYLTAVTGGKGPLYLLFYVANALTFIISLITWQSSARSWNAESQSHINACKKANTHQQANRTGLPAAPGAALCLSIMPHVVSSGSGRDWSFPPRVPQ